MKLRLRIDDGRHRQATWLELLFDLAFVIGVSTLAHGLIENPTSGGLLLYASLFVPVWWIWNQFVWYASHFDNDDFMFRLLMLSGIAGTLFLSQGIHTVSHGPLDSFIAAYLFLHAVLAVGWVRAYRDVREYRPYSRLKLTGIVLGCLFWWLGSRATGTAQYALFAIGTGLQLLMPVFAWVTVKKMISVHHHHLQERHGLFVMILLGECLVSIARGLPGEIHTGVVIYVSLLLLVVFGLWWIYFDWKYDPVNLRVTGYAFAYNYGHLLVYGALGLVAAGIGLMLRLSEAGERLLTVGAALFLAAIASMNWLSHRERDPRMRWAALGTGTLLVASLSSPMAVHLPVRPALVGLALLALIAFESTRLRS